MKRSRAVRLTLVASTTSAAVAPAACAGPGGATGATAQQALHCVARGSNRVVPDSLCDAARRAASGGASGTFGATAGSSGEFGADTQGTVPRPAYESGRGSGGAGPPLFLWYYGGHVANGSATAGSYAPAEGVRYRSGAGFATTGTARAGFFSRVFGGRGARGSSAVRGGISRGGFGATGAAHASGG